MLLGAEKSYQTLTDMLNEPTSKGTGRKLSFTDYGTLLLAKNERILKVDISPAPSPIARYQIVGAYLSSLEQDYFRSIRELISNSPPMKPNVKVAVCIPVAMPGEHENILNLLKIYEKQTLPRDQFEIILLLNHPVDVNDEKKRAIAEMLGAVHSYAQNSGLTVIPLYGSFKPDLAGIGFIRKVLHDAALVRHYERPNSSSCELWMVVNDADTTAIAPQYLEAYVQQAERHPTADYIVGRHHFDYRSIAHDENLLFALCCWERIEARLSHAIGDATTPNPNFAVGAASYAACGGMDVFARGAECYYLQRRIAAIRLGQSPSYAPSFFGGLKLRLYTSPRRLVAAANRGFQPWDQWNNSATNFSTSSGDVRNLEIAPRPETALDYYTIGLKLHSLINLVTSTASNLIDGQLKAVDAFHPAIVDTLARLGVAMTPPSVHNSEDHLVSRKCEFSFDQEKVAKIVKKLKERARYEISRYTTLIRGV